MTKGFSARQLSRAAEHVERAKDEMYNVKQELCLSTGNHHCVGRACPLYIDEDAPNVKGQPYSRFECMKDYIYGCLNMMESWLLRGAHDEFEYDYDE